MSKKKKRDRVITRPPVVTFRTLGIDFDDRTVSIDGRTFEVQSRGADLVILSGEAVFVAKGSERIA